MDKQELTGLLKSYKYIMTEVRELNKKITEFVNLKDYCTVKAATISDMPKSITNEIHSSVEDLVIRYADQVERYAESINKLLDDKALVEKMLSKLEPIEKRIVELRYITNPERHVSDIWTWISIQTNYSRDGAIDVHSRAIKKMMEITH
jgi:DNA-directed RNA polymerase specialized sigma subunit